jgi:hypothetical protein
LDLLNPCILTGVFTIVTIVDKFYFWSMKALIIILAICLFSCTKDALKLNQRICYACEAHDGLGNNYAEDICTTGNPVQEVQAASVPYTTPNVIWKCKEK